MKNKLRYIAIPAFVLVASIGSSVFAQSTGEKVIIVEFAPGSSESATSEFVELHNLSFKELDLTGWRIQYKSANGSSWSTKSSLSGIIYPGGRYLVSSFESEEFVRQDELSSGMAQSSGHIRLVDELEQEIDLVGWGDAGEPLNTATVSPKKFQSLKRNHNEDGYFSEEGNNLEDWFASETPTPFGNQYVGEDEVNNGSTDSEETNENAEENIPKTEKPVEAKPASTSSYAKIEINEFLPDPDSPQTDAEDEFVELYNPNKYAVNLENYVLESGNEYRYSYTIPKVSIAANSFLALFSIDTNLTLPNSGSQLRLLSPTGLVLSEFVYDSSKAGQSWAKGPDGKWAMTSVLTPNANNQFSTSESSSSGSDSSAEKAVSSAAVQLSEGNVAGTQSEGEQGSTLKDDESERKLNNAVLAGVGLLAVLYAIYEYRHDIGNRVAQARRYLKNRRENRA